MKPKWLLFPRARNPLRRGSFAFLVSHFFQRFFAGEVFSGDTDLTLGIGGILALLALPGAILPLLLLPKYSSFLRWLTGVRHFDYNTASIPDKYILLTFTMAITGIVAVFKWDSLFPDRLDFANLAPLPARVHDIFLAKFTALLLFVGLFVVALNAASTVLFPFVVMGNQTNQNLWLRFITAHAVAVVAGSAFMFFSFFALAGLLMALLPHRRFRQVSTPIQFGSVIMLVMSLLTTPEIGSLVATAGSGRYPFVRWLPTVWFLGLYQQISGRADAEFHTLALRAIEGLAVALGASLLFYAASYRRFFRRVPEMMETAASPPGRTKQFVVRCFDGLSFSSKFERACVHFAAKTLARSQRHGLLLAGFAGMGVAVAIQNVTTAGGIPGRGEGWLPTATVLASSLAVVFFLLSGLRFIFDVPAELSANWTFRAVGEWRGAAARQVGRKLALAILSPVIIVTAIVYSAIWGRWLGIAHTTFVLLASLLMIDVLFLGYRKIPFTCSYSAGKHNGGTVLAVYFLAFFTFSPGLANLEHWALSLPSVIPFLVLLALLATGWIGIRKYERQWAGDSLIFTDEREPVVPSMDLR